MFLEYQSTTVEKEFFLYPFQKITNLKYLVVVDLAQSYFCLVMWHFILLRQWLDLACFKMHNDTTIYWHCYPHFLKTIRDFFKFYVT